MYSKSELGQFLAHVLSQEEIEDLVAEHIPELFDPSEQEHSNALWKYYFQPGEWMEQVLDDEQKDTGLGKELLERIADGLEKGLLGEDVRLGLAKIIRQGHNSRAWKKLFQSRENAATRSNLELAFSAFQLMAREPRRGRHWDEGGAFYEIAQQYGVSKERVARAYYRFDELIDIADHDDEIERMIDMIFAEYPEFDGLQKKTS